MVVEERWNGKQKSERRSRMGLEFGAKSESKWAAQTFVCAAHGHLTAMWTAIRTLSSCACGFNGCHDRVHGRDRDRHGPCTGRGRGHDRDPIYGCARRGHVSLPNSRYRSARHRDEARPSEHLHRVAGSNSLDASDSDLRRDTSSRRSR